MQDGSEYQNFQRQICAVGDAIQDTIERYPPMEDQPVPANWKETQAMLQTVAEDIMLCVDVDQVLQKMKGDQAKLLVLRTLIIEVDDAYGAQILRNAFASRPQGAEILPGQAFATYLLELCRSPAPIWHKDE